MTDKPLEKVSKSLQGQDEPLAKKHPIATWNFLWLIYFIALVAVCLAAATFESFFA